MVDIDRIKNLRISLAQNQTDVANALNLSRESYCMYENGMREPPYETLVLIAKYYNVSLDYLFGLSDSPYSFEDYSDTEMYIVRNLHDTSPEIVDAFYTMIKWEHIFRRNSIHS